MHKWTILFMKKLSLWVQYLVLLNVAISGIRSQKRQQTWESYNVSKTKQNKNKTKKSSYQQHCLLKVLDKAQAVVSEDDFGENWSLNKDNSGSRKGKDQVGWQGPCVCQYPKVAMMFILLQSHLQTNGVQRVSGRCSRIDLTRHRSNTLCPRVLQF